MNRKNRSDAAAADGSTAPDFEKSLQQLEQLVAQLERGDLPLAESLALFEQGVGLTRSCHTALTDAQQRVEMLLKQGELQPFNAEADSGND
jgi:exodeoxyribonuclease VII small subunit